MAEGCQCERSELGNSVGNPANVGDFLFFQPFYWSSTDFGGDPNRAWYFNVIVGYQGDNSTFGRLYALAVRDGDVLANRVPEPESLLLALTALGAMALVRRRRAVRTLAA